MKSWVGEKEEWLADWSEARRVKDVSFISGLSGPTPRGSAEDVFFSDVLEAAGRCLVCRACGPVVDIFDISPSSGVLLSWRVHLPGPIVPDIGISHVSAPGDDALVLMFLTKAQAIHRVHVGLRTPVPEVSAAGTTACRLPSAPSSFCALDQEIVAVGCFSGALHAVRLSGGAQAEYEFTDASVLRRMVGSLLRPTPPLVLALAAVQLGPGAAGFGLLAFSADGQLRLWEAREGRGQLVASRAVLSPAQDHAVSLVGASSIYMRVSSSQTRACLVLRHTVYLIDLPAAGSSAQGPLAIQEVSPPFPAAAPSLVALSGSSLWSFWSGQNAREQLFRLSLGGGGASAWEARAMDAGLVGALHRPAVRGLAAEGCGDGDRAHRSIFTLYQQHEVWKVEEDGFDIFKVAEVLEGRQPQEGHRGLDLKDLAAPPDESFDRDVGAEELVLRWWVGRVFLPGRYSTVVIAAAVREAGGALPPGEDALVGSSLRTAVEELVRRRSAHGHARPGGDAHLQVIAALAEAAGDLLRACDALWLRKHQVCGIGASRAWAPHTWLPAGDVGADRDAGLAGAACPLLLCHGGVSCIRPVHSWCERIWTTCHLSRDVSNYERMELEDVLALSPLAEWKLCVTAWFLSQCLGCANLGLALALLRRSGPPPSASLRCFVKDVPKHLAEHVAKCAESLGRQDLASQLETLQEAVAAMCSPEKRQVVVLGRDFDASSGAWGEPGAAAAPGADDICLSDVLRGGIAAAECEYACVAMRDLLLLCAHAGQETAGAFPSRTSLAAWGGLSQALDQRLPLFLALHQSMKLDVRGPATRSAAKPALLARGCDLWAAAFRVLLGGGASLGLRPPVASFQSLRYALRLLHHGCWDALRWWSRHQRVGEFAVYVAACEWLAAGKCDAASEAFIQAESVAPVLMECLRGIASPPGGADAEGPALVGYYEHVAGRFGLHGQPKDEYLFLRRAATLSEELSREGDGGGPVRQRIWSAAFEKAVGLEMWDEAYDALLRIEYFEGHLRLLAQKLRSCGRIELMLKLPDKHRTFFMNSLHEHASLSPPIVGSDSLACYHHLYALHFAAEEYLKAAAIAHTLYAALGTSLQHFQPGPAAAVASNPARIWTGDCISRPADVPKGVAGSPDPAAAGASAGFSAYARALDHVWPLLDQQRNALLMLISALSLTPEGILVAPPPRSPLVADQDVSMGGADSSMTTDCSVTSSSHPGFREWFSPEVRQAAAQSVVSVQDAEGLLAVAEAQLVLAGSSDVRAPADVARRVAELGLLSLSLQIANAHGLDAWECALQPFVGLCLDADEEGGDADGGVVGRAKALAEAAQGPPLAFMFPRCDGAEPLGTGGSVQQGWWEMLERALETLAGAREGGAPDAGGTRLYSLVADAVLTRRGAGRLPRFLEKTLASGPLWVCLLRLHMKHGHLQDASELLAAHLQRCELELTAANPPKRPAIREFPVDLALQLQRAVRLQAPPKGKRGGDKQLQATEKELSRVLEQMLRHAGDVEKSCR